jgi:hypothetical protein
MSIVSQGVILSCEGSLWRHHADMGSGVAPHGMVAYHGKLIANPGENGFVQMDFGYSNGHSSGGGDIIVWEDRLVKIVRERTWANTMVTCYVSVYAGDGTDDVELASAVSPDPNIDHLGVFNGKLIYAKGSLIGSTLAQWDGSTWTTLGSLFEGPVAALESYDGELIVGGDFLTAGSKPSPYIAAWTKIRNGRVWYVAVDGSDQAGDGSQEHPFATIQHGLDSAITGDTVLVHPGTYTGPGNRDIDFGGKDIVVMSENGPEATIIDCEQQGRGFYLHSGETRAAKVSGFTITRGTAWSGEFGPDWGPGGAGILCIGASPTIEGNRIIRNFAWGYGGGINCQNARPLIVSNVIAMNTSNYCFTETYICVGAGGGIWLDHSDADIISNSIICNTLLRDNVTLEPDCKEGGIGLLHSSPHIERSIIAFNLPLDMNCTDAESDPLLLNCDLYHTGVGTWTGPADQLGINGNFSGDPMFCDTANGDYHLSGYSRCAPENNWWDGTLIGALAVGCGDLVCGDANQDGQLTEADVNLIQAYYFFQTPPDIYVPVGAADMDCNDRISLNDLLILTGYFYGYGPAPCCVPLPPPPPKHLDGGVLD